MNVDNPEKSVPKKSYSPVFQVSSINDKKKKNNIIEKSEQSPTTPAIK